MASRRRHASSTLSPIEVPGPTKGTSVFRTTAITTLCSSRKLPYGRCPNKHQILEAKMKDQFTRRRFLQSAGAAAYVGAGLALPSQAQAAAQEVSAGEVKSMARMFPGCCAYSYRKYLKSGQMSMQDFIREIVKIGSAGADMTVYWFKSTDSAYLD